MTIYYVRPTNGNDGNAGTSFAAAWKTTQKALDSATAAGDEIRLCAEATETKDAVSIDVDTNTGAVGNKILVRGMDGTDGTSAAQYTIQATGTWTGNGLLDFADASDYYTFRNITLDCNSVATEAITSTSNTCIGHTFETCVLKNATADGAVIAGSDDHIPWAFLNCDIHDNGGNGIATNANGVGPIMIIGGTVHDNASTGVYTRDKTTLIGVQIYDNGDRGVRSSGTSDGTTIDHCTIHGNTSDGIEIHANADTFTVTNNSIVSNGAYGVQHLATVDETIFMDYNHFYNNTSGETDLATTPGQNNQSGDPLFVSVTDGSEDFTPAFGSPLAGNGIASTDMGAKKAKTETSSVL